jgi:multicomponent Na+:H+ antiporter subunit E
MNLSVAIVWTVLRGETALISFLEGFAIGFVIILALQVIVDVSKYTRKVLSLLRFFPALFYQFLKANLNVARLILFVPKDRIQSGVIRYDVSSLDWIESYLISHLITLMPGTISVNLTEKILDVHVLDLTDKKEELQKIDVHLRDPLLRLTR